jgi:hypothetical protein
MCDFVVDKTQHVYDVQWKMQSGQSAIDGKISGGFSKKT